MNLPTNTRPRLRKLLVPLIVAATIVVPVAAADNGPEVKGENYYARGLLAQTPEPTASISIPTSTAFQWSDAAVGAGSSLVLVGLAIGGYFVLRRRHLHVRVT